MNRFMAFAAMVVFLASIPAFAVEGERMERKGQRMERRGEAQEKAGERVEKRGETLEKKRKSSTSTAGP